MKKLLISLAAAVMAVGCTMVDEGGITVEKNALLASSKDNTRTEMVQDGETFYHNWVKGDAFALMDGARFIKYELQGEGGSTDEVFTGEAPVGPGPYYVYYPYKETFMDIYTDATVKSTFEWVFPSEVEYTGGNIAGEDAMIGLSIDGKKVSMKNMCGYVRLNIITPSISFLKTLEITAPGGEAIAGPYHVDLTPEGIPELTPLESYENIVPSNKVTINFPDKIMTVMGTELFVPLPAIDLSEGLTFVFKGDFDGEEEIRLSSSTATLERNIVLVMPDYSMPSQEAKIGDVLYETLAEAFAVANASNEDVTIDVLRTCVATTRLPLNNSGTGEVTLNLNGRTVSMTNQIRIAGRKLTITDLSATSAESAGSIISTYSEGRAIYLENKDSELIMNAGKLVSQNYGAIYSLGAITLEGNASVTTPNTGIGIYMNGPEATLVMKDNAAIDAYSNSVAVYGGKTVDISGDVYATSREGATFYTTTGVMNISGGDFHRAGSGNGYVVYTAGADAVVNISGGYFENFGATNANPTVTATSSGGTINVSGGYFLSYGVNPVGFTSPGVSRVTGGYFNKQIQPQYLDGLVNVLNSDPATREDYPFTVAAAPVVAVVTQGSYTYNHAQFESAVAGANQRALANGAATVTMQEDAEFETVKVNGDNAYAVNLDLNGKTVSSTSSPAITVENGAVLNISDGSAAASGELDAGTGTAVSVAGTLNVNNGSVVGTINVAGGTLKVADGHFYGANADITNNGGSVELGGGFFKNVPDRSMLNAKCTVVDAQETFNGRRYAFKVESAPTVSMNGVGYGTLQAALVAAKNIGQEEKIIQIKLLESIVCDSAIDFSNNNGLGFVLDLNGYTISTDVTQFITTTADLTITDYSNMNWTGAIVSSKPQVIYLHGSTGSSTVTVEKVTIKSTFDKATNTETGAAANSAVYVYSNGTGTKTFNLTNGARIWTPACHCIYGGGNTNSTPALVNIENAELTSGFYCIYFATATVTVAGDETSFYSENALTYCGTSNANGKMTITGGYFNRANGEDRPFYNNYLSHYTFGGGFYNATPSSNKSIIMEGFSMQECSVTHVHKTTGATLNYAVKCATN